MNIAGDLHTHTVASGHAYSTLAEMCRAAHSKGLAVLGMTDHGPALPGGPHPYHFGNLRVLPVQLEGVYLLRGVEANIVTAAGELDLPDSLLVKLDWVLAGFHSDAGWGGGSVMENTDAVIAALENPVVDAIVHPGNPVYPVDIGAVVTAARGLGKAIEINNSSLFVSRRGSEDNCRRFADAAARMDCKVLVSSDAHVAGDVGRFDRALELITAAGVPDGNVVNATLESIEAYLKTRGKRVNWRNE